MLDNTHLQINASLRVPRTELEYRVSRSGGPGGQHVNTASTRVELWWDIGRSPSLSDAQRATLVRTLALRLDARGRLRLVAAGSRSQYRNRLEVTERFQRLVDEALAVRKIRRATRPTAASKRARLDDKRRRSNTKQQRKRRPTSDE
ncbi:MAG: aminoacyl-tRNA hydrolase [Gemmatimonadales bacterium]|nr:aminoacyl-tRNA hydrolase [Gemmatimonadales bacterium]